ncbi:MAG: hypothetical protein NXI20_03285 [bacterium]|nr:hypothetical protein [bacterium]
MIRIYLDWNVVSNLKRPEYQEINEFISNHKEYLQFPYTPAHFSDLMKSFSPENKLFHDDLQTLENLSGKHFFMWSDKGIEVLLGSPKEYFKDEANQKRDEIIKGLGSLDEAFKDIDENSYELGFGKIGSHIKSMYQLLPTQIEFNKQNEKLLEKMFPGLNETSSFWDLMESTIPFIQNLLLKRDFFKDLRNEGLQSGFKLDVNSGNWPIEDVIQNIEQHLKKIGYDKSFQDLAMVSYKNRDKVDTKEFYTTSYLLLDFLGYKIDKLKKPTDNLLNVITDSEHSFYGAYCDFLVAEDKNLIAKTSVLYKEHNISTVIIEPKDFIEELNKVIHDYKNDPNILLTGINQLQSSNMIENHAKENANFHAYKLPIYYLNFFNYLILTSFENSTQIILTFRKVFHNMSSFLYITEVEQLFNVLIQIFGFDSDLNLEAIKNDFVNGEIKDAITWNFEKVFIKLEIEPDTHRPTLHYIIESEN